MSEKIHSKKLFKGRAADEIHRRLMGGKCLCGQPAAIMIRVFAPLVEMLQTSAQFVMRLQAEYGSLPVVDFKTGKFLRVSQVFACDHCKTGAEREAAKAPSHWCVEIDRGPGPEKTIVQVPS